MATQPPLSVLCVDDDEDNRHAMAWFLQREGFRTREAANGAEALRLAADKPDVIILDVGLPDLDGFEVCRRIKAHPATAAIPVLHVSGRFVRAEDRTQGLEGGAEAFLTKPVEPQEVLATVRSLLRVHQAEEAARAAAEDWQATFDAIHDALWLLDADGRVRRCNRAMAALLGRPVEAIQGRDARELLREVFGPGGEAIAEALEGAATLEAPELALGKRWFRVAVDRFPGPPGLPGKRVYLLSDVTHRRALEEQLRQAQKMEAIGQLAGGVAHDFNNFLTAVTGNLALALSQTERNDPRRESLVLAEKAAWQAADLTSSLLGFARRGPLAAGPVDLGACIREVLSLLRRTLDSLVEVVAFSVPDLWPVRADAGQMSQVLMNLCLNARDAVPRGGQLTVTAYNAVLDCPPAARAGEFVRLRVEDTGEGIPAENLPHIFEPFFTTKGAGKGTGLGLATVFGIVQRHGGWVECDSEVGRGTCFSVYLPRLAEGGAPQELDSGGGK